MLKGLLATCEEHKRPFKVCFMGYMERHQAKLKVRRARKMHWKFFQWEIFQDTKGCRDQNCGKFPAIFWAVCPCGCGARERVCRRHQSYRAWCPDLPVPPPVGTGTVYRQQVKRIGG